MTVIGKVYRVRGKTAYVKSERPESCVHCESRAICNKKEVSFRVYDTIGVSVGDFVELETRNDATSISIIAYIFLTPVLILFLSYFLFTIYNYLAFSSVIFLAVYFYFLKKINEKFDPKIKIIKITEKNENL